MKLTAAHVVLLLLLIGGGQLVAGVYLLAGIGWAVVAMSIVTIAFAAILSRGLSANG
jgi:hypothetical protein